MPVVVRTRRLAAPPAAVWRTVGDPHQLARWWPKVLRVEGVTSGAFTQVLQTKRGTNVRADYTLLERRAPRVWHAEQEVEGTPFEGVLAASDTHIALEPAGERGTLVTITLRRQMKGVGRLGAPLMRRATERTVESALDNLEELHAGT
ncbi:MAG TPA: SRPBCC family protein [Solirubrobacteraceae bacterium]|nr:SRPBCC family protein [Solirubrobacteraceae bacterium]